MSALIDQETAFIVGLDSDTRDLLMQISSNASVHRRGLGQTIDGLTVAKARGIVEQLDKELSRIARYEEALIIVKEELTRSVR